MNEKTELFLKFLSESKTVDLAGHMAAAYAATVDELAAAKAETARSLIPNLPFQL